ncbi:MAG: hypothetical protein ACR2JO_14365 [Mycobacteriales bacterium]
MSDQHGFRAAGHLSRRSILLGGAGLLGVALGRGRALAALGGARAAASPDAFRATNADGLTAYPLAMHLHDSFSEGKASKAAQIAQAAANNLAGLWTSNHDWRVQRLCYVTDYHFAAGELHYGKPWNFTRVTAGQGSLTSASTGGVVAGPTSPSDPATEKGAFRLYAESTASQSGTLKYRIDAKSKSRMNYSGSISGLTISIDVCPVSAGPGGWLQLYVPLSVWPSINGLAAGAYSLLYRFRTDISQRVYRTTGTKGTVDVPVILGRYQTVTIDRVADIARLWPAMPNPADNGTPPDIELQATSSSGFRTEGYFAYLRFTEDPSVDGYAAEAAVARSYASYFPGLFIATGTEFSFWPHLNRYGGSAAPYDYGTVTSLSAKQPSGTNQRIVDFIHGLGGIASINHPFKSSDSTATPPTPAAVAADLIAGRAYGAELLEVGYRLRDGVTVQHHIDVWDALSRNNVFVTGNGVSDDHSGQNWASQVNRYYTTPWAATLDEPSLLSALASGRTYVGYLGGFAGALDCYLDAVPMGKVDVSALTGRTYRVDLTGLPTGAIAQVLRGVVDNAGTADATPNTSVVATLSASDVAGGSALVAVDTSEPSFFRTQVVDGSTGAILAFGQPIWSLPQAPPTGIPAPRQVAPPA